MPRRFDADAFVAACDGALDEADAPAAIAALVEKAIVDCGESIGDTIETLHASPRLTVQRLCWGPGALTDPHDHRMWAVVGVYGGREENRFYERHDGGLRRTSGRILDVGEVLCLPPEAIHDASSAGDRWLGGLHVYGGDLFGSERSAWDPGCIERPYESVASQRRQMLLCLGVVAEEAGRTLTVSERRTAMLALWAAADGAGRHLDEDEAKAAIRSALALA